MWPNASTKQTGASRIRYIDAYRGVAALGVAWFHIYTCLAGGFAQQTHLIISFETLDAALNYFALWGRWGVRLFCRHWHYPYMRCFFWQRRNFKNAYQPLSFHAASFNQFVLPQLDNGLSGNFIGIVDAGPGNSIVYFLCHNIIHWRKICTNFSQRKK